MESRNDRLKGMSYTELERKYNVDPRTAKRYAESPARPEHTLTGSKPTKLDESNIRWMCGWKRRHTQRTDTGKADGTGL